MQYVVFFFPSLLHNLPWGLSGLSLALLGRAHILQPLPSRDHTLPHPAWTPPRPGQAESTCWLPVAHGSPCGR